MWMYNKASFSKKLKMYRTYALTSKMHISKFNASKEKDIAGSLFWNKDEDLGYSGKITS